MKAEAEGWAVTVKGEIDVRTVSPTEIGAKVNGLMTVFWIAVGAGASDSAVNDAWNACVEDRPNVRLVQVKVLQTANVVR
jgi:hypothetical protein